MRTVYTNKWQFEKLETFPMTPQYLYWVCEKFKFLSYLGWENSSFGIVRMNLPNYSAHILIVHRTKLLNVIPVVEFQRWWVLHCKVLEPVCCKKRQKKSQPKNWFGE